MRRMERIRRNAVDCAASFWGQRMSVGTLRRHGAAADDNVETVLHNVLRTGLAGFEGIPRAEYTGRPRGLSADLEPKCWITPPAE
jgi:hypothetical protein